MSKKKILVLAENVNYNRTSSGIRSYNMLRLLSEQYDVTCIHLESFEEEALWKLPKVTMKPLPRKATLHPFLTFLNRFGKIRALPTYITGLTLWGQKLIKDWVQATHQHLASNEVALIFVLGTGHDFHAHHAAARLQTTVPIMVHIHDPYPYNHYPEPYKQTKWLYTRLAKQFNKVMDNADYISFPSVYLSDWMSKFYPQISEKKCIIPHPECTSDYSKVPLPPGFPNLLDENFNLMHLGSLLKERNPIHLFKAFKTFCNSHPEKKAKARLYIIGKINSVHQRLINENWNVQENIQTINQRLTYPESKKIMDKASALIILEAIASFSPFMPGKISDYIKANKLILALTPEKSEVSRLLGPDYPYKCTVDNESEILLLLNALWAEWKQKKALALNRPDLNEYISVKQSISVFEKAIQATL